MVNRPYKGQKRGMGKPHPEGVTENEDYKLLWDALIQYNYLTFSTITIGKQRLL